MIFFYLKELKYYLVYSISSFILTAVAIFLYSDLFLTEFTTNIVQNLIINQPAQMFQNYITLSIFISICFLSPFTAYYLYLYINEALYKFESKQFLLALYCIIFALCATQEIVIHFVFPTIFHFFLNFTQMSSLSPQIYINNEILVSSYLAMYTKTYIYIFFLLLAPMILNKVIGSNSNYLQKIISNRRILYFILIIVNTLICPPDINYLVFYWIFSIILFEISLFTINYNLKKHKEK